MLRRAPDEAANIMLCCVQRPFALQAWGRRIAEAKGTRVRTTAVARKLPQSAMPGRSRPDHRGSRRRVEHRDVHPIRPAAIIQARKSVYFTPSDDLEDNHWPTG